MLASRNNVRETPSVKHHLHCCDKNICSCTNEINYSRIYASNYNSTSSSKDTPKARSENEFRNRLSSDMQREEFLETESDKEKKYNPRMKGLLAGDCKDRLTPVSTISLYYGSAYRRCHQSPELWLLHNKTHSSSRDNPHHKTSRHELRWWVMMFYVTTRLMLFQVINFTQLFHFQGWSFDFKSRNVFKALDLILLADLAPDGHCQEWRERTPWR